MTGARRRDLALQCQNLEAFGCTFGVNRAAGTHPSRDAGHLCVFCAVDPAEDVRAMLEHCHNLQVLAIAGGEVDMTQVRVHTFFSLPTTWEDFNTTPWLHLEIHLFLRWTFAR